MYNLLVLIDDSEYANLKSDSTLLYELIQKQNKNLFFVYDKQLIKISNFI